MRTNTLPSSGSDFRNLPADNPPGSDVDEDPSPTQKIYGLIAQLQARHDQAVAEMSAGYANGEPEAASRAMKVVRKVERIMPKVGSRARKYFLSKVHG